jgi:tetratricopeptide (TPR) repeat protein
VRTALLITAFMLVANEACVGSAAERTAALAATGELARINELWSQYDALERKSYLGVGVAALQRALTARTEHLANQVIDNYRTQTPTVREAQWRAARDALQRAVAAAPRNQRIKAALRYCEGHLHRIDGDAQRSRRQMLLARQEFTEAVAAFREAAELRPEWPDPFLGLMRTFIYGLEDIDRAADALKQAERLGFKPGDRETAQLADGYRRRGETIWRSATDVEGLPQESEYLQRAADSLQQALKHYSRIPAYAGAAANLRRTQRAHDLIQTRVQFISGELGGEDARWR